MVQYLHFRILKFPLIYGELLIVKLIYIRFIGEESSAGSPDNMVA